MGADLVELFEGTKRCAIYAKRDTANPVSELYVLRAQGCTAGAPHSRPLLVNRIASVIVANTPKQRSCLLRLLLFVFLDTSRMLY